MKELLTIGELARLMNVSTHQIRYFEEQEVLLPDEIGPNGYRKYGVNAVYILGHILCLRDLGISVGQIKECFSSYSSDDYIQLFDSKVNELDLEINRLIALRDDTKLLIKRLSNLEKDKSIKIQYREEKYLKVLHCYDNDKNSDAINAFEYFKDEENLYKADVITYFEQARISVCLEVMECSSDCIVLEESDYLTDTVLIKEESEIDQAIKNIWKYARKNGILLDEKVLLREHSMLSIAEKEGLYFDIEVKVIKKK